MPIALIAHGGAGNWRPGSEDDAIEAMRGPWCASQVRSVEEDRCTTGLLHHVVSGHLAQPGEGTLFCAGCSFETLYALGTRRTLAGEPF